MCSQRRFGEDEANLKCPECGMFIDVDLQNKMIWEALGEGDILTQLAEEAAELAQAALKLRRAAGFGKSPTPTNFEGAWANFLEEIADVLCCLEVYSAGAGKSIMADDIIQSKRNRWVDRLQVR